MSELTQVRILAVDDDTATLELFDLLLTLEGFDVRTVADATTAIDQIVSWQPHLVILDIMMPGLDGRELARLIRAHEEIREDIGIVFHSALASDQDTWEAWRAGADSYLTKPSDPVEVVHELIRVLNDRRAADRTIAVPEPLFET